MPRQITIEGYAFVGPFFHTRRFEGDFPCVYVLINTLNDIVDVGETSNINDRIINHERKTCWVQNGCSENGLYVCIIPDQNSRLLLEKLIRIKYNPVCGVR